MIEHSHVIPVLMEIHDQLIKLVGINSVSFGFGYGSNTLDQLHTVMHVIVFKHEFVAIVDFHDIFLDLIHGHEFVVSQIDSIEKRRRNIRISVINGQYFLHTCFGFYSLLGGLEQMNDFFLTNADNRNLLVNDELFEQIKGRNPFFFEINEPHDVLA
jgi:hypothetical protein